MYKKNRTLASYLNYTDTAPFSRNSINTIIRALLDPVANQNASSLIFTRFKNKEGIESLIRRLEYCNNVEIVDVTNPELLKKDNYVELEFIIFTSARYNFAMIFDYSKDEEKNYSKLYFVANSRKVNDVFEILQDNMVQNYKERFYLHKPERRENDLLNDALFNILDKLNSSMEENEYRESNDVIVEDVKEENEIENKIKEFSHEIKNQISVMDVYLKLIEKQNGENEYTKVLRKSLASITESTNNFRHDDGGIIEETEVFEILSEAANTMEKVVELNQNKIILNNGQNSELCVFANKNKLLSVIINILKNANESTKSDKIIISLSSKADKCFIDIENHGSMIKKEHSDKIFEKDFSTKTKGAGIGLYSSKKIIEDLRGELILLESSKEKTVFRIILNLS